MIPPVGCIEIPPALNLLPPQTVNMLVVFFPLFNPCRLSVVFQSVTSQPYTVIARNPAIMYHKRDDVAIPIHKKTKPRSTIKSNGAFPLHADLGEEEHGVMEIIRAFHPTEGYFNNSESSLFFTSISSFSFFHASAFNLALRTVPKYFLIVFLTGNP